MNFRSVGISLLIIMLSVLAVTAQDSDTAPDDLAEMGRTVYRSNGCTSCHGLEGEGSTLAPPLAGTSEVVIRRQIRAPLGIMPNFTPEDISSEELDALVLYLLQLEAFDSTEFEGERLQPELGEEIIMRHWMTLLALEVDDIETAHEHIDFILEYVEDEHAEHMQEIVTFIDEGEIHEAQHILESMTADVIGFEGAESILHLQILLSAIRAEDYEEAEHQLEHYVASENADETIATTIESLLDAEQYDAVEIILADFLAEISLTISSDTDHEATGATHEHEAIEEATEEAHDHD